MSPYLASYQFGGLYSRKIKINVNATHWILENFLYIEVNDDLNDDFN